jgi:hypothetical protein
LLSYQKIFYSVFNIDRRPVPDGVKTLFTNIAPDPLCYLGGLLQGFDLFLG